MGKRAVFGGSRKASRTQKIAWRAKRVRGGSGTAFNPGAPALPLWERMPPQEHAALYQSRDGREAHYAVGAVTTTSYHLSYREVVVVGFRRLECIDGEVRVGWCKSSRGSDEKGIFLRRGIYLEATLNKGCLADAVPPGTHAMCSCAEVLLRALGQRGLELQLYAGPR
eukprot:jgi/Tetstr1/428237/TSEL_018277.t1